MDDKTIQQQAGGGFGTITEPEKPKGKEKPNTSENSNSSTTEEDGA